MKRWILHNRGPLMDVLWWIARYLAESGGELQQAVVAQVEAEQVSELLLHEVVVHQAGQRRQLVPRQVQQTDPLPLSEHSRALAS